MGNDTKASIEMLVDQIQRHEKEVRRIQANNNMRRQEIIRLLNEQFSGKSFGWEYTDGSLCGTSIYTSIGYDYDSTVNRSVPCVLSNNVRLYLEDSYITSPPELVELLTLVKDVL